MLTPFSRIISAYLVCGDAGILTTVRLLVMVFSGWEPFY
jgi:hypothetical protein